MVNHTGLESTEIIDGGAPDAQLRDFLILSGAEGATQRATIPNKMFEAERWRREAS